MRILFKTLIVVVLFVQQSGAAYAWGAQGHRLIVEMAMALLTPTAKQHVMNILNGYPIDDAAVWMDSVRENKIPEWAYMREWHFLNMDPGQTYAEVASDSDVVFRLDQVIKELEHPDAIPADSLPIKLRVLFHLMGDITQPLHVGYGYDEGGNTVKVRTAKFNTSGNELHAVWDGIIIKEGKINLQSSLAYYHGLDQDKLNSIIAGSTQDWMMQARSYLSSVYNFQLVKDGVAQLSLQYLDSNVPVVQQQIVFAAVRLANTLNTVFGSQS
ncbi:MAG TPA: S1/P1 nuclease [Puia sp.]|jgi:hypothetical protein|nr:S1/P1 nuclease [Puia sp.]